MKITEKNLKNWFPHDRRFLHFCARYYGYSFYNDEVVEFANEFATKNVLNMYHQGREFDNEKHMTAMVMSSFRFGILNGYKAYDRYRKLQDRPMSDYDVDPEFNSVLSNLEGESTEYDNTMDMIKEAMQKLPDVQSELVRRKFLNHENLSDIAKSLGISYTDARRHERHALKQLRDDIENETPRKPEHKDQYPKYKDPIESLPAPVRSKPPRTNKAADSSHSEAMSFLYS